MLTKIRYILLLMITCNIFTTTFGNVKLSGIFQSHMVLQQKESVVIWGWGDPDKTVNIKPSWGKIISTKVNADGTWKTTISTLKSGGVYSIKIFDYNSHLELEDILFGEVWLCSGQSNMNFPIAKGSTWKSGVVNYQEIVSKANHPQIRFFDVERKASPTVMNNVNGRWQICNPQTAGQFSAVAYYFALALQKELKVPIGIITSTWGGTPLQSWTKIQVLETAPIFSSLLKKSRLEQPNTTDADSTNINSRKTSYLYNGMIAPLIPFQIKGMLWYQGENNVKEPFIYKSLFPSFIASLRTDWKTNFPFYFVQLAPYRSSTPELREAQFLTYKNTPGTGITVITDGGDSTNIHPRNKELVGNRLSLWALAKTYNKKIEFSGPLYKSVAFSKGKAIISFDFSDGLNAPHGKLNEFTIAGSDKKFYRANAIIKGGNIIVWSDDVVNPTTVRYAWKPAPDAELFNSANLPASSFRTDIP